MKKFIFFLLISFLFFSCAQNLPAINSVTGTSIFDYESETSFPEMRLGVFVDVSSDVHRVASIKTVCLGNNFTWECQHPFQVTGNKKQYAGYTNFVMPENEGFLQGQYIVYYTDLNGNQESNMMNLSYDSKLLSMKVSELENYLTNHDGTENWAVFDSDSELLFFGEKNDNLRNLNDIWRRFPEAEYARTIWVLFNGRTMCILPVEFKYEKGQSE